MDDIIREGHPTLRLVADEVSFPLDEETKETAEKMLEFLKNSQDPEIAEEHNLRAGVGIAAPQIDLSKRFLAVHVPSDEDGQEDFSRIMFNPVIISHSVRNSALASGEGCLSVDRPVEGIVPRHDKITVKYSDINGDEQKERLRDFPSVVVQHEIDHLNGVMFYDRIDPDNPLALPDDIKLIGGGSEEDQEI